VSRNDSDVAWYPPAPSTAITRPRWPHTGAGGVVGRRATLMQPLAASKLRNVIDRKRDGTRLFREPGRSETQHHTRAGRRGRVRFRKRHATSFLSYRNVHTGCPGYARHLYLAPEWPAKCDSLSQATPDKLSPARACSFVQGDD